MAAAAKPDVQPTQSYKEALQVARTPVNKETEAHMTSVDMNKFWNPFTSYGNRYNIVSDVN